MLVKWLLPCVAALIALAADSTWAADALLRFDFTRAEGMDGWTGAHDVQPLTHSAEGMVITATGDDPFVIGPEINVSENTPLWLIIRLKPDSGGSGQIFYFPSSSGATEEASVRFNLKAHIWQDARVPLKGPGEAWRLRFDPPGGAGKTVVASISLAPRIVLPEPKWPKPEAPAQTALRVRSGDLELVHAKDALDAFVLKVNGRAGGFGLNNGLIGYQDGEQPVWFGLDAARCTAALENGALRVSASVGDPGGATWLIERAFQADKAHPGVIRVDSTVTVDADRSVLYLGLLGISAQMKDAGAEKDQAVFAGLEYLSGEPSSSEADVRGVEADRRIPDSVKITFPLMAVQTDRRYLGVIWDKRPEFAAVFDSPDRTYHSGGHIMQVVYPGSDGLSRPEHSLIPYEGQLLKAHQALKLSGWIVGGRGESIVPALQQYVEIRGLPELAKPYSLSSYVKLAADGWLRSKIHDGPLYRHAYWPGFNPGASSDAALYMRWLAEEADDRALASELRQQAAQTIAQVDRDRLNRATISHISNTMPSLVFGHALEAASFSHEPARLQIGRFEANGDLLYHPRPGGRDYGSTHYAKDANGYTAGAVETALEDAVISGDASLVNKALRLLKAMNKFDNAVPRGAQTWELPLHTPDILASAHLVRCYTMGYQLTGESSYLERARYWAWTGVPFIYLVNPVAGGVGLYGTVPVFGASDWVNSWFGRPVQWCGLVYANALYDFVQVSPKDRNPWLKVADGIVASGMQQTWTQSDPERQGLLPDFYLLRAQMSDGPAINPGTLQANAVRSFGKTPLAGFCAFPGQGVYVHAAGAISKGVPVTNTVVFTVNPWPKGTSWALISGVRALEGVEVNGTVFDYRQQDVWDAASGQLALPVAGRSTVRLTLSRPKQPGS